ncbi:MAG: peptidoglycan editing factor PgeF [Mangrovibacterium sp.]
MEVVDIGQKSFLKFKNLKQSGVFHFTTTKSGWGKDGQSRFTGDEKESYQSYREELARALGICCQQLIFPRQAHSDRIVVLDHPVNNAEIAGTDALITNQHGLCICVQTADCVPILLYDPCEQVVAAVHAGWRGTVSKIVAKTIHRMQLQFDSEPEDLIAGIGPSIHHHVYEVGQDVIIQVRENFSNFRELLKPSIHEGKAFFDLWAANKNLMVASGMKEKNIEVMGLCSWSHESLFYSARRDGAVTGRMATGIMLK